jgi:hypothetical protein
MSILTKYPHDIAAMQTRFKVAILTEYPANFSADIQSIFDWLDIDVHKFKTLRKLHAKQPRTMNQTRV